MSGQKKLQIVNLGLERQKSESNAYRTVELSENKNKQDTVSFLSYLLAIRAINCWLERSKYPIDVREALEFLGLRIKTKRLYKQNEFDIIYFLQQSVLERIDDLHQELEIRVNELYEIYEFDINDSPSDRFKIVEHYLDKQTSIAPQEYHLALKTNYQNLVKELDDRFEGLASFWEKTSIHNSLIFFRKISIFLHSFEREYQQNQEKYLDKENASFQAYKRFMSAIRYKDNQNNSEFEDNIYIAKQSLLNSYKFKTEAETYSLAIRALNSIARTNQMYIEVLQECHSFLTKIKTNFLTLAGIVEEDYLFFPLVAEKITNHLDLDNLQKKVEIKLGHSLHTSRRYTGVTMDEVQNVLIEEVRPIAKKICSDTYHQLKSEVDSFE